MINPSEYAKQVDMVETVSKENYSLKVTNERLSNQNFDLRTENERLKKAVDEAEIAMLEVKVWSNGNKIAKWLKEYGKEEK